MKLTVYLNGDMISVLNTAEYVISLRRLAWLPL